MLLRFMILDLCIKNEKKYDFRDVNGILGFAENKNCFHENYFSVVYGLFKMPKI